MSRHNPRRSPLSLGDLCNTLFALSIPLSLLCGAVGALRGLFGS